MTKRDNGGRLVFAFFDDRLAGFDAAHELGAEDDVRGLRGEVGLLGSTTPADPS